MSSDKDRSLAPVTRVDAHAAELSNKELLGRIVTETNALVRKQIELARAELIADVRAEAKVAKALGASALLALCGLNLALVTLVFALALVVPGWAAGLIVTGLVLTAAAVLAALGWRRRVRRPLERTRKQFKEDVQFMKERLV